MHALATLFFAFTVAIILREVYTDRHISTDSVCGPFVRIPAAGVGLRTPLQPRGLLPARLAFPVAADSDRWAGEYRRHLALAYFSFITLTTVGYGDVLPHGPVRGLVIVEAVLGQFYLGAFIADLVGKKIAQATTSPPPGTRDGFGGKDAG